jgi:hypothetical protein
MRVNVNLVIRLSGTGSLFSSKRRITTDPLPRLFGLLRIWENDAESVVYIRSIAYVERVDC